MSLGRPESGAGTWNAQILCCAHVLHHCTPVWTSIVYTRTAWCWLQGSELAAGPGKFKGTLSKLPKSLDVYHCSRNLAASQEMQESEWTVQLVHVHPQAVSTVCSGAKHGGRTLGYNALHCNSFLSMTISPSSCNIQASALWDLEVINTSLSHSLPRHQRFVRETTI